MLQMKRVVLKTTKLPCSIAISKEQYIEIYGKDHGAPRRMHVVFSSRSKTAAADINHAAYLVRTYPYIDYAEGVQDAEPKEEAPDKQEDGNDNPDAQGPEDGQGDKGEDKAVHGETDKREGIQQVVPSSTAITQEDIDKAAAELPDLVIEAPTKEQVEEAKTKKMTQPKKATKNGKGKPVKGNPGKSGRPKRSVEHV
jgi:hypothetical protein